MTCMPSVSPHHSAVVRTLLESQHHVLTTKQLYASGLRPQDVRGLVEVGLLVRLRRGVLADGPWWEHSAPWERHAVRARGFARCLDRGAGDQTAGAEQEGHAGATIALSHHSALAVHGVSLHAVDDLVHMCPVDGRRGHRSTGLQLHGPVDRALTVTTDGLLTVVPALACLQVAGTFGAEAGLVSSDAALRQGLCTADDLRELGSHPQLRIGRRVVDLVVRLADGRRESAGESRTAWLTHLLGFEGLVPQVVITDQHGIIVARVDFLIEGTKVIVEFDGMLKYEKPGDLAAEKVREDRLRELGYEVVRLTWDDLNHPEVVRAKLQAALERAARRAV